MSTSQFTKAVVQAVRNLYPETLADSSFDNTGLLLEAPFTESTWKNRSSVLLTGDLTKGVADEAIKKGSSIVIAYHPIIFRGLKSLTLDNTQQNSLIRLAQAGISVYSPHTAVDAAPGGLNDWLADIVTGKNAKERGTASKYDEHNRENITPVKTPPTGFEAAGYGRIVRFEEPQTLGTIAKRISQGLSGPDGHLPINALSIATPQHLAPGSRSGHPIKSIGICAGSGGSMLGGLDVDLLFTGELSHHEALAAIEQGRCVITAFHSNTERGFLREVTAPLLKGEIATIVDKMDDYNFANGNFEVLVSEVDRDPFEIIAPLQSEKW